MSQIIKPEELLILKATTKIIIIDARTGKDARDTYSKSHLDGALFVDLNTQLTNPTSNPANGGRHPLPGINQFLQALAQLGISLNSHVIVYDDKNGSNAAARFWWMLKAVGHNNVQVLDGGFDEAVKACFPLSSTETVPVITEPIKAEQWLLPIADMDEVDAARKDSKFMVIDVRDAERYAGKKETIDLIAGHIPGAINIPFTTNLDSSGFFLSKKELREKYLKELDGRETGNVIVHCGSGVTACHTILAMANAGIDIPKLYVGSWSEWSRNNCPIASSKD